MSKFDEILNKLTEEMPNMHMSTPGAVNPTAQQTPQQQQQAVMQAAKLLNMDPKALQQILDLQKTQQPNQQTQTTNKPAV